MESTTVSNGVLPEILKEVTELLELAQLGDIMSAGKSLSCVEKCIDNLPESNSWSKVDSSEFHLRIGPNYNSNKQKASSPPSLMTIVGVE